MLQTLNSASIAEAERIMTICNACRYCEGHCAVFPAMTRRLSFAPADLGYLANLCHNCGSCYHHCQYADPHEFDVKVPEILSEARRMVPLAALSPSRSRCHFERVVGRSNRVHHTVLIIPTRAS